MCVCVCVYTFNCVQCMCIFSQMSWKPVRMTTLTKKVRRMTQNHHKDDFSPKVVVVEALLAPAQIL